LLFKEEGMDDLYREIIVERYKEPLFRGTLDPHDITFEDENPLCGDQIRIDLRVSAENTVTEAAFSGHGCAISQASADLLLEAVIGKSLNEIRQMTKQDVLDNLGIELGPVRLKCALLPLKVLKAGVYGLGEATDDIMDED
jgi:nitrogen fixation protein NifU and related proteins